MSVAVVVFDVLLALTGAIFAWLGLKHGKRNAYWVTSSERDERLLRRYYAGVMLFAVVVVAYGVTFGRKVWPDLIWITAFVGLVHAIRFFTDWVDLKDRPQKIEWRRPIFDFSANLFTLWFAIFVSASGDRFLALIAVFFGLMFIAKEMYFRLKVDVFKRSEGEVTTSQGGDGEATDPRLTSYQSFFGRYLKSYFYVIVGLGIIYLMIPILFLTGDFVGRFGSNQNHVADTFWFTVACLTQVPPGLPPIVMLVVIFEIGANLTLVLFVLYLIFTRLVAQRAR